MNGSPTRLYVPVALGWPVRGRAGYRGVGTVVSACRADARVAAGALERALARGGDGDGFDVGPVRALRAGVAGVRLLAEGLAADGRRALARRPGPS